MIGAPWKGRSGTNLDDFSQSKHLNEYKILLNLHRIKNVIVSLLSPPQQQFQHPKMFQMAIRLLNWTTCQYSWSVKHVGVTYFWKNISKERLNGLGSQLSTSCTSCGFSNTVTTGKRHGQIFYMNTKAAVSMNTVCEISTRGLVQYKDAILPV